MEQRRTFFLKYSILCYGWGSVLLVTTADSNTANLQWPQCRMHTQFSFLFDVCVSGQAPVISMSISAAPPLFGYNRNINKHIQQRHHHLPPPLLFNCNVVDKYINKQTTIFAVFLATSNPPLNNKSLEIPWRGMQAVRRLYIIPNTQFPSICLSLYSISIIFFITSYFTYTVFVEQFQIFFFCVFVNFNGKKSKSVNANCSCTHHIPTHSTRA